METKLTFGRIDPPDKTLPGKESTTEATPVVNEAAGILSLVLPTQT